jgi:hypothetical protein
MVAISPLPIVDMVLYARMEKPAVISPRVYSRHRTIIKKASRKLKVSEAEVVRRALEAFTY